MSPKKKKRPIAAQQLIDSLLDDKNLPSDAKTIERGFNNPPLPASTNEIEAPFSFPADELTPTPSISSPSLGGPVYDDNQSGPGFSLEETSQKFELDPIAKAAKTAASGRKNSPKRIVDTLPKDEVEDDDATAPNHAVAPPFEGTRPLVTKMVSNEERLQQTSSSFGSDERQTSSAPFEIEENTLRIEHNTKSKFSEAPSESLAESLAESRGETPREFPKEISSPKIALDDDRTVPAQALKLAKAPKPSVRVETQAIEHNVATEIRTGVRTPPPPNQSSSLVFASSDAALKQSESLRIAQSRISELEAEMERLRRDNESLATAGDTLRRRMDELLGKAENLEIQSRENQKIFDEEKKVLRGQAQSKERENADLRARMEELELRLESNFKKIRVRERELEHRLEIVKMESATLVSSKDKMILDLKRQIDQLSNENDFAKIKTQELFNQHKEKQETIRRVVRALRIALTILEGDEDNVVPLKKAE